MLLISLLTSLDTDTAQNDEKLEACLIKIAQKDTEALGELYNMTKNAVYSFALSILKSSYEAEDVLHDCYVSIFSNAERYTGRGKPMAWIMTITKNLCYMRFREKGKLSTVPEEDWENYISENEALSHEDRLIIRECMMLLTEEERNIVSLHAVAGMKHREIAKLLDLALPTVLSKYRRTIIKLRQILADEKNTTEGEKVI